jgi:hypothetical protein
VENMNNETWLVTDSEGVPWELGCRPSRIGDTRKERPARRADIVGALALKGLEPVSSIMLHEVSKILQGLCGWGDMSLKMSAEFVEAEIKSARLRGGELADVLRRFQELFCWAKPLPLKDAIVLVEDDVKKLRTLSGKQTVFWHDLCDVLSLSVETEGETALQDVRELQKSDERLRAIIKEAEEAGWDGVENSKFLSGFILDQATELAKRELELDELRAVARDFLANVSGGDDGWHRRQARLAALAKPSALTDEERQKKYIALEADRAARGGKPRGNPKRALLAALHSMRLAGTDDAILRKMAEDGGVEWSNPDLPVTQAVDPSARIKQLEEELETERMRLAACGVAALDGSEQQAIGPGHAYYSAAYGDVLRVRRDADRLRGEVFSFVEEVKLLESKLRDAHAAPKTTGIPLKELPEAVKIIEHDIEKAPGNTITLAKQEVRFLLEVLRAHDDPQNDATDGALPAWWRGHDHTAVEMGKRLGIALKAIGIKAASWQEGLEQLQKPIPMRLLCEACRELHIDEGEFATRPHHTHACQHCGSVWRPAVVATVGVQFLPGFLNKP